MFNLLILRSGKLFLKLIAFQKFGVEILLNIRPLFEQAYEIFLLTLVKAK